MSEREESRISEIITIISVFFTVFALSIYVFTLGYLDFLSIPEFPSYTNSLAFFVKGLFSKWVIDTNSNIISIMKWSLITFVLVAIGMILYRNKPFIKNGKFWVPVIFSGVIASICMSIFKGLLIYLIPVSLPSLLAFYSFHKVYVNYEGKWTTGILIPEITLIVFLNITAWIIPYSVGKAALNSHKLIHENFPKAWSGEGPNATEDWLIWMEDDRKYWFVCGKHERIIYGKNSDGKIFFSRNLSDDLGKKFCRDQNSQT